MLVVIGGIVYEISADVVWLFCAGIYSIGFLLACGWAWVHSGSAGRCEGTGSEYEDDPACNPQLIGG
jgi:hypothetical protein